METTYDLTNTQSASILVQYLLKPFMTLNNSSEWGIPPLIPICYDQQDCSCTDAEGKPCKEDHSKCPFPKGGVFGNNTDDYTISAAGGHEAVMNVLLGILAVITMLSLWQC